MKRLANRVDSNHGEIMDALRGSVYPLLDFCIVLWAALVTAVIMTLGTGDVE